jgi:hemoglobin
LAKGRAREEPDIGPRPGATTMSTIFERYGGFATARKIVSSFYDRILESPALEKHFVGVDMRRLIDHQTKFIASVMGGPAAFDDEALRRAHARLGITPTEFAQMAALLRETLEEFALEAADIEHIEKSVLKREALIVSRDR